MAKAKLVIETSGVSSKDWFERAVANAIKQGSSDYTQDLTELEHHTTHMYELMVNMIQRSVYLKDHAVKEVADKLESKESIITGLQQQTHQLKQELGLKSEEIKAFVQKVADLEEKLKANGAMLDTNQWRVLLLLRGAVSISHAEIKQCINYLTESGSTLKKWGHPTAEGANKL